MSIFNTDDYPANVVQALYNAVAHGSLNEQTAAIAASPLSAIALAMQLVLLPPMIARADPVPAYTASSTPIYLDPAATVNGSGTFASPYQWSQRATAYAALNAANKQLLMFAFRPTVSETATRSPAASGSSSTAAVVVGVCDPTTGERLTGRIGAVKIDCTGMTTEAIKTSGLSFVCIDGIQLLNPPTGAWGINMYGSNAAPEVSGGTSTATANSNQILNCLAIGGDYHFTHQTSGSGHLIQNCVSVGAAQAGMLLFLMGGNDTTSKILHSSCSGAARNAVVIFDYARGYIFGGDLSGCTSNDSTGATTAGFEIGCKAFTGRAWRNTARRNQTGMKVYSTSGFGTDWSGMQIQNNILTDNEFNFGADHVDGYTTVRYNVLKNAGSKDGVNPVTSSHYGRNMEIGGFAGARCRQMLIEYNDIDGAWNWSGTGTPGTEGVGIALDNESSNCTVRHNTIKNCQGNGVQYNVGWGNAIYSNILVGNWKPNAANGLAALTIPDIYKAEIYGAQTPGIYIGNNTLVCLYAAFGVSDSTVYPSSGGVIRNNLIAGATIAAVSRHTTNGAVEDHTVGIGVPALVRDQSGLTATPGTGTGFGAVADFAAGGPLYAPTKGGACDGTGATPLISGSSILGRSLFDSTPIGAMHAV